MKLGVAILRYDHIFKWEGFRLLWFMIKFPCWRGLLNIGMRTYGNVWYLISWQERAWAVEPGQLDSWAWVPQGRMEWVLFFSVGQPLLFTRRQTCLRPRWKVDFSWNGYLSFVFLLTEWGNASEATQMLPSDLTIFGLQKELLKYKQEGRNLQGIKVKKKTYSSLNKLFTK